MHILQRQFRVNGFSLSIMYPVIVCLRNVHLFSAWSFFCFFVLQVALFLMLRILLILCTRHRLFFNHRLAGKSCDQASQLQCNNKNMEKNMQKKGRNTLQTVRQVQSKQVSYKPSCDSVDPDAEHSDSYCIFLRRYSGLLRDEWV